MRFAFLRLPLALGLSACTQANMTSDTNGCEGPVPPDGQAVWRMVAPGVLSTDGPIMSGKNRAGGATTAAGCVHQEDNKGTAPQIHDLQKIG
jgi:hypothetical protein